MGIAKLCKPLINFLLTNNQSIKMKKVNVFRRCLLCLKEFGHSEHLVKSISRLGRRQMKKQHDCPNCNSKQVNIFFEVVTDKDDLPF